MILMSKAIFALGSNMLEREKNINIALNAINNIPKTRVLKVSSLYDTQPFGVPNKQDNYLNCCALVQTELNPEMILGAALGIESSMGRRRTYKNAARIIDIDLLLYDNIKMNKEYIIVPHPRIRERAFVMVPLRELFNGCKGLNFDFSEDFNTVDKSGVIVYRKANENEWI